MSLDALLDDIRRSPPDGLLIWSGAGISVDLPTGGPRGIELTDRALRRGFQEETGALLACYYAALDLERRQPRLETVLHVVNRVHGTPVLVDLLSDLAAAPPNGVHRFLAELSRGGATQVTANFDSCLEDAGARDVLHFHGSLASDPSGLALGATLARIERGLPRATCAELDRRLHRAQVVVFVGYSGSDFFDVDPYLKQRLTENGSMQRKIVVWLTHGDAPVAVASGAEATAGQRQLEWFHRAGASVHHLRGPTRELLALLGEVWGMSAPSPPSGRPTPWTPTTTASPTARRRASLELYALMGLHREVDRLLEDNPPADRGEWNVLAHTRWAQGRKREAAAAWREALEGLPLQEREAAVEWVRGRYRRARRIALDALRESDSRSGTEQEPALEERLVLAETLARVWQHMRRYPDSRPFATEKLRRYALAHLPDPAELAREGRSLGTHLTSRVRGARAALGEASEGDWEAVESFGEYEALSASLNYEHGRLREDAERGVVPPERFQRLYRHRITIGDTSAAASVMLLPGANDVFSWREVFTAVRLRDASYWHRLRLLTLDLARRLRWPRPQQFKQAEPT